MWWTMFFGDGQGGSVLESIEGTRVRRMTNALLFPMVRSKLFTIEGSDGEPIEGRAEESE